jgi:hypothetical protein
MTDWEVFRTACLALLSGHNPYSAGQGQMLFFNPPWTLVPLLPFALLPPLLGLAANALASIASILWVSRRLHLTVWEFFFVAVSPMHLQSMLYGNIEWIPLLGLLCPPPLALLFYLTKPHATAGLIILLLVGQWKTSQWHGLLTTILPAAILSVISVLLWGFPPLPGPNNPGQHSLFPFSLLLGIPALYVAIKREDKRWGAFVGPFVSPYVTFHGYLPALFPFRGKWMGLAVLVSFLPVVLNLVA